AKPRKKRHLPWPETSSAEGASERIVLEVDRNEGERGWDGDACIAQARALGRLSCRMVDLEDPQRRIGIRIPIRERVEAGTEDHVLTNAPRDRLCETILRVPTSHGNEGAQVPQLVFLESFWKSAQP